MLENSPEAAAHTSRVVAAALTVGNSLSAQELADNMALAHNVEAYSKLHSD